MMMIATTRLPRPACLAVVLLISSTAWLAAARHSLGAGGSSRQVLAQAGPTPIITELVVLGDSYSDTGRLFRITNRTRPSPEWYWHGRYSNGPTWPEYLYALANNAPYAAGNISFPAHSNVATTLSGFNYTPPTAGGKGLKVLSLALGGSPACEANKHFVHPGEPELVVPWLDNQVDDFRAILNGTSTEFPLTLGPASQRAVVIEFGGNDYNNQLKNVTAAHDFNLELPTLFGAVPYCIVAGARRLLDMGERNLIFFTLPLVDKVPQSQVLHIGLSKLIGAQAQKHNERLRKAVANLRVAYPDAHILLYELGNATQQILDHPERYNITDTKGSCLEYQAKAGHVLSRIPLIGGRLEEVANNLFGANIVGRCEDPNHVWFDRVHPTTTVHRLYAEDVAALMQQAGLR